MSKKLLSTPYGGTRLEVETSGHRRRLFILPSGMSPSARIAFLASPRLVSILARLEEEGREDMEGYVTFALHKLAMDLMTRHPANPRVAGLEATDAVVPARLVIQSSCPGAFVFCTSYKGVSICRETRGADLQEVLAAALRELPSDASAVELTYDGIATGTYPRHLLERRPEHVADAALRTREAIDESLHFSRSSAPSRAAAWSASGGPEA